jgi:hypothetical protein
MHDTDDEATTSATDIEVTVLKDTKAEGSQNRKSSKAKYHRPPTPKPRSSITYDDADNEIIVTSDNVNTVVDINGGWGYLLILLFNTHTYIDILNYTYIIII